MERQTAGMAPAAMQLDEELSRSLLNTLPSGLVYCRMIYQTGEPVDFEYVAANDAFVRLTGLTQVVGQTAATATPGLLESDGELIGHFASIAKTGAKEQFEYFVNAWDTWFCVSVYSPKPDHFAAIFDVITEKKSIEAKLRDSHTRYHAMIDSMSEAVLVYDRNATIDACNDAAQRLLGLTAEQLLGRGLDGAGWEVFAEDMTPLAPEQTPVMRAIRSAIAQRNVVVGLRRPDGVFLWLNVNVSLCRTRNTEPPCSVIVAITDITDRRRAEAARRESEARFRHVFGVVTDAIFLVDCESGRFLEVNPAAEQLYGYTRSEFLRMGPSDISAEPEQTKSAIASRANKISARRHRRKDGSEMTVEITGSYVVINGNSVHVAVIHDIGARLRTVQDLRESKQRFSAVFRASPVAIVISQPESGVILEANAAFCTLTEFQLDEVIGRSSLEIGMWVEPGARSEALTALRKHGKVRGIEMELRRKSGSRCVTLVSADLFQMEDGSFLVSTMMDITERKRAEAEAQATRNKLQATLDAIPDLLFEVGKDGCIFDYHSPRTDLLAASPEVFLGKRFSDVLSTDAANACLAAIQEAHEYGVSNGRQYELMLPQGKRHFELSVSTKPVGATEEPRFLLLARDITERKRAENELRIAAVAFDSQVGILVTDAKSRILRVNSAFSRLTGYSAEEVIGKTPAVLRSGRNDRLFYERMWESLLQTGHWQGEMWNRRKDGRLLVEWLSVSAVRGADGSVSQYVGTFFEITKHKEAEAEIHRLANFDALTDLPNRRTLNDRMTQSQASSSRNGRYHALVFLDLDNFKLVNDSRSHSVGDLLLVEVARRIQDNVRKGDTVARLGGDEFVVMLEDLSTEAQSAAVQARQISEKLRVALSQPYQLYAHTFHCTASLGLALFRGQEESTDTLLKHAELAMYRAKSAGRNAIRFFDSAMQTALEERSALEADLRFALERQQFRLYYQPQVDSMGRVIGAEALLRWHHPVRGLIAPGDFVPLCEENGLILSVGAWVLATACDQIKAWSLLPATRPLRLAVNVSARQFRQPDFVDQVEQLLVQSGADPTRLKIELTESVVLDDVNNAMEKMHALKCIGVGFALDDFGTGNSSLSYLTRLPLDQLKIDRSFVLNLPESRSDAVVAQTVIAMALGLGLEVIAEGVETPAQRSFLEHHGCHTYQGYLYSRPLPLAEFEQFVARNPIAVVAQA